MRFWKSAALGVAVSAGLLSGCGGADEPAAFEVTASEYKFETSGSAHPGSSVLTFKNTGKEVHHLQLLHLDAGKTMQDLGAALQAGDLSKVPGKFEGGVGQLAPGASGQLRAVLSSGTYAMLCFVPAADGAPHFVKGMAAPFEVKGEPNDAKLESAKVEIVAKDYSFDAPDKVKAGDVSIQLTNSGKDFHEANVFKLATGVTPEQALKALATEGAPASGPPPVTPMGGAQGILPGQKTTVVAKLDKGNYMLVCFIPDAQNVPHIAKGMVRPLTVE